MTQLAPARPLLQQIDPTFESCNNYIEPKPINVDTVIDTILKDVINTALVKKNRDNLISDQELISDFFHKLKTALDNNPDLIEKAYKALIDFDNRKSDNLTFKQITKLQKGVTNLRKAICEILREKDNEENEAGLSNFQFSRRTFNSIAVASLSTVSTISSTTTLVSTPKLSPKDIGFVTDLAKKAVDNMATVALGKQGLSPKRQNIFNILTLNMRASFEARLKSNAENNPVIFERFQNIASLQSAETAEMQPLDFPTKPNPFYSFFLSNFNTDGNWKIEKDLTKIAKLMEMLTDDQISRMFEHNETEINQKIIELENMLNYMGSVAYHALTNNHEVSAKDIFNAPYKKIVDELESEKSMLEVKRLLFEQSESQFSILA
jgi:hypothetical protein